MSTPYVLIDDAQLARNIAAMAARAEQLSMRLRPHVKTHKIPEIAQLQLEAGASGITVATVGEAELFDGAGDVFIAYPLWPTKELAKRINSLDSRVTIGVDSVEAVGAWRSAGLDEKVGFMIELDSGHHRSGTTDPVRVATACGKRLRGLFTFPGHAYQPGGREAAAKDEHDVLVAAREAIGRDGLVLSGGSTPSAEFSFGIDEIRPGVYVFNDAQQVELGACSREEVALVIRAQVVSRREDRHQVVVNAGSKILGADKQPWASGFGLVKNDSEAQIVALSEHHATIVYPEAAVLPGYGEILEIIPNHVCAVLNLVDEVHLLSGGIWNVPARGKNS